LACLSRANATGFLHYLVGYLFPIKVFIELLTLPSSNERLFTVNFTINLFICQNE
jgi:hypothetical protein